MVLPSSRKRKGHCELEEPEAKCPRPRRISKTSLGSSSPGQIMSPMAQNVSRSLKQILKAIASKKSYEVVEILKSSKDSDKLTIDELNHALYQAVSNANYFVTRTLIQHGANMDFKDTNEKNCLHVSAERGYLDIAQLLVMSKFNVDDVDCHGNTALILCQNSPATSHTTELLVNAHAMVNIQNKAGETALLKALGNQNVQAIMLLLKFKADATLKDIKGNSAESLATDLGVGGLLKTLGDGYSRFGKTHPLAKAALEKNIPQLELLLSSKVFNVNDDLSWRIGYVEYSFTALSLFFSNRWMEREAPVTRAQENDYLDNTRNLKCDLKSFSSKEFKIMSILLKAGASIHFGDDEKTTPILMATHKGDHSLLSFLLKNEVSPIPVNFNSYCKALYIAASKGRHDLIALIAPKVKCLSSKMKCLSTSVLSSEDYEHESLLETALYDALLGGYMKCVDKILPLIPDLDYSQAVSVAAGSGHYSVYCKMKDFKPQLFTKLVTKKDGSQWLNEALDNYDIVASLLRSGAKPSDQSSGDTKQSLDFCKSAKVTKLLLQFGAKIENTTEYYIYYKGEEYAMVNAVITNSPEMVKILINYGATVDINLLNLVLVTKQCKAEIRKLILSYDIDLNQFGYCGKTAIFHAVNGEDFESLVTLVKKGADVNLTSGNSSLPPLIVAALKNNLQMLSFLLEHGANVDITSNKGDTALTVSRSKASITLLSSKGANLNALNNEGCSALRISVKDDNFEVFCALIAAGADVNIRCEGHTLLSNLLMDKYQKEKYIKYLLDHGGKVSDRNSMFAVHICIVFKDYSLLSALLSSGQFCPLVLDAANPDCLLPRISFIFPISLNK